MIFIDSGAFFARHSARDQHFQLAILQWQRLAQSNTPCFTSSLVLDETITLLFRRASPAFALERAKTLFASQKLTILRPDQRDELEALEVIYKFADQKISFTDCVSSVLMKKHSLKTIFTFDAHFKMLGFECLPD